MTTNHDEAADPLPAPPAADPPVPAGTPLELAPEVAGAVLDAHPRGRARAGNRIGVPPKRLRPDTREEVEALRLSIIELLHETGTPDGVATNLGCTTAQLEGWVASKQAGYQFRRRWREEKKAVVREANGIQTPFGPPGKDGNRKKLPNIVPPGSKGFQWTQAKRDRLLAVYIDTGDLLGAQRDVGVTPSQFNDEVDRNSAFNAELKSAERQARRTRQLIATSEALKGNDRLLANIIKEGDEDSLGRLSDTQLAQRLTGIISRIRSRLDPGGTENADVEREAGAADDAGGGGAPPEPEPHRDAVPRHGSVAEGAVPEAP